MVRIFEQTAMAVDGSVSYTVTQALNCRYTFQKIELNTDCSKGVK